MKRRSRKKKGRGRVICFIRLGGEGITHHAPQPELPEVEQRENIIAHSFLSHSCILTSSSHR